MARLLPAVLLLGSLVAFLILTMLEATSPAVSPDLLGGQPAVEDTLDQPGQTTPAEEPLVDAGGDPLIAEVTEASEPVAMLEPETAADGSLHEELTEVVSGVVNADAEAFADEASIPQAEPLPPVLNFDDLQPAIDWLMNGRTGRVSVSILSGQGFAFNRDASGVYPLASVAKLYILTGYLDYLAQQDRGPDETETFLLEGMIGWSDNFAAEAIWELLGGTEAMQLYLQSRGFDGLVPAGDLSWGGASSTAADTALFLSRLTSGQLLDPERTAYAMSLLAMVEPSQRWGVTSGVAAADPNAGVLLKNGWYPDLEGWRVNSAGLVVPGNGVAPYVLVIFTDGLEDYEDGVRLVESIARMANTLMLQPATALEEGN